ncbi:transcriptional regulator, TetR family [Thermincola ferriacetica]|uniref:Transcriptional regulator, TetR family n=1 Tax=Thermincola ferriacetica TaxID=281456 RepID=A0A0L6VZV0_9FIRM|nr:TetR/AcrR family transcriptional regulator [Thermincola ferriacetica]KNZ68852.1 transcriptional regulator, TetR family [Thermincola ferriacetica]
MDNIRNLRRDQAHATKRKLIDKAFRLFEKYGYDNVTIDQICNELGLTKGAFYHHFRSKADILLRRYKIAEGDIFELFNNNLKLPPDVQLRKIFDFYLEYFQENRLDEVKVLIKIQMDKHYKNFALTSTLQRQVLKHIIQKGQESGCFKKNVDSEETARFIMSYLYGLLSEWCAYDGKIQFSASLNNFYEKYLKEILFLKNETSK